ncbi:TPA: hypothetical protein ACS8CD_003561 [Providencia alcalifaciens]|uniref:Uncharacterized protein n=1 Tax=Providencia alcalifaciens TaxID=126385 RepID=A0AAW9VFD2_9GAMM|nr:hypothetical protein [Providencia alcalifaciens]
MLTGLTLSVVFFVILMLGLAILGAIKMGEAKFAVKLTVIMLIFVFLALWLSSGKRKEKSLSQISLGEHYANQCQLIETNIDNGLFQSNTNKLKCGDVIENVTVVEYQDAVKTYQESVKNGN